MHVLWRRIDNLKPIDYIVIVVIVLQVVLLFVGSSTVMINPDLRFMHNRALQMYNCLADGNIPYFYYKDFGGVGYGSAFFYGHLTLYPFVYFAHLGIDIFLKVYTVVALVTVYLGASFFCKRFTLNYKFISLMFIVSSFMVQRVQTSGTPASHLALGISLFFLAYCIDFFRDNKSWIKATIVFFILLNTHLLTSVLSFVFCVFIMIYYFDKSRLKDYFVFATATGVVCSYNITNMLYHYDIVTSTDEINKSMIEYAKSGADIIIMNYMGRIPFLGCVAFLVLSLVGVSVGISGFMLVNEVVAISLVLLLISNYKKLSRKNLVLIFLALLGVVISERSIWVCLNEGWNNPLQFPVRFTPYIILLVMIFAYRYIGSRKLKVFLFCFCLTDLMLSSFMTSNDIGSIEQYTDLFCQVENGEYLDESFVWETDTFEYYSSHVTDEEGKEYQYSEDNDGGITVSLDGVESSSIKSLTIPKLYYKGYKCYNGDKEIDLKMGYSQFIEVDMTNYKSGSIYVIYRHPVWLIVLNILCYIGVVYLVIKGYKFYKRNS